MKNNNNILREMFNLYDLDATQYIGKKIISRGHINNTYTIYFDYGNRVKRYLLQEINTNVFKDSDTLMKNIELVTEWAKQKLKSQADEDYKNHFLRIYPSKEGKSYVKLSDGSCWRIFHYIENCVTYDITNNPILFYEAGKVIGKFQNLLADFDSSLLKETIPDFHNTVKRYEAFEKAVKEADSKLVNQCKEEIEFYRENRYISEIIQKLLDKHQIPLRVTHNDTKLNNIMFQYRTDLAECVVDLDTIMPGTLCFDFGDFVRSACNAGEEDAKDLSTVVFQKQLCIEFTKGFLSTQKSITELEVKNLIVGALDMTYECGMRFLTDFLNGNIYFNVEYPEHNLDRCHTQMSMFRQIKESQADLEERILNIYYGSRDLD